MKKKDIFLMLGIVLFIATCLIDRFIFDLSDMIETIIYIISIIFLLLGYLFDSTFMNSLKALNKKQKILYILLLAINIIILGFIDLVSNFWFMLLYLVINYILGWLIYRFIK